MNNFEFYNGTKLIYGRDEHKTVGERLKKYAKKVLLHYGGGSIKRNGVYDDIVKSLQNANIDYVELGGVKPNPTLDLVYEGIKICREENVDFILAVGGGSAIDSGKAIACGVPYDGDVWELFGGYYVKEHLPIATVLTLPASGSESSDNGVVTNEKTLQKFYIGAKDFYPVFSIINPEIFYTLPKKQISAGAMDMLSHTMERYFTNTKHTEYVDRLAEATMKTIMKYAEILLDDQTNYDAWFEFALAGTFSHNGITGMGRQADWSNHRMEDEMAATYNITHGEGLSVITLAWMEYVYKTNIPMFVQFAVNVMGVEGSFREEEEIALEGIRKFRKFVERMNLPTKMSDIGIDDSQFEAMAKRATRFGTDKQKKVGHFVELDTEDIIAVYRLANRNFEG